MVSSKPLQAAAAVQSPAPKRVRLAKNEETKTAVKKVVIDVKSEPNDQAPVQAVALNEQVEAPLEAYDDYYEDPAALETMGDDENKGNRLILGSTQETDLAIML